MLTGTTDELLISLLSSGPSPFLVACLGLSCPGGCRSSIGNPQFRALARSPSPESSAYAASLQK